MMGNYGSHGASSGSRFKRIQVLSLAFVALLAACGGQTENSDLDDPPQDVEPANAGAASGELREVTFRTDVAYNGTHVPYAYGIVSGIYADYGLDVEMNPGQGSSTTLQLVSQGNDDIGFADASALIRATPEGIDALVVSGIAQESPNVIFALPESGITEPSDLIGAEASYTSGSAPELLFPAFAEAHDFNEADVTLRNVDIPTRNSLLVAGEVDFTFGFTTSSLARLEEECDCDPITFEYRDAGITSLSSSIVVSPAFAEAEPEIVRDFVAATTDAIEATIDDHDAGVQAFFEVATDSTLSVEAVGNAWLYAQDLLHTAESEGLPIGCMTDEDWSESVRVLEQYTDLEEGLVDPATLYTNEYFDSCQ